MRSDLYDDVRKKPNLSRVLTVGVLGVVILYFASGLPAALVAVAVREMLFLAAACFFVLAALRRERMWGETLSGWDQAAMLMALSLLAGMFIDPEAASQAMLQLKAASN